MITLREDQADLIQRCRSRFLDGCRSVLMVAATGFGKTVTFSWLAQSAASKGKRVLILVHRDALLDQVSATLDKFGVPHSFIAPDRKFDPKCLVQVASVFCLARRIDKIDWAPDLIIVDEAHHAIPGSTWNKVLRAYTKARILGATATPERLGGQGLIDTFECMELGPEVRWLIDQGALSDFVLYRAEVEVPDVPARGGDFVKAALSKAKNTKKITGNVIDHYRKLAHGMKALGFCVDIAHAQTVAAEFRDAGYRAASIDGDMQRWAQRKMLDDFASGALQIMTSCDLVSEGFDVPSIECGIFLRDTKSLALARQQMGRVLRFSPNVKYKVMLDHAGIRMTHGRPDDEIPWSLEGKEKRPAGKNQFQTRKCPACFADLRPSAMSCKYCGHEFQVEARVVKYVDAELVEDVQATIDKEALAAEVAAAKTVQELTRIGKARGYKNPGWWAIQVANGRTRRNA